MKTRVETCLIAALGLWGALAPWSVPGQTAGDDIYQAIVKREFGTAQNELAAVEKEIQEAKPDQYPRIEGRLIAVLQSPEATLSGKQFACQMLRIVGSSKCIPAVSQLLTDEKLSHIARLALQGLRDPAVDESLRKALGQTQDNLRIGIINTIGDRADRQALDALAALLSENDEATARAALNAIGKIGGAAAADALDGAKPPAALKAAWAHAYLRCAPSVAAAGDAGRAEKMYRDLFEGGAPPSVRAGAFGGLVQMQKEQAVPLVIKTLFSSEALLRRAALTAVITVPGRAATKAFGQELASQGPDGKVALLGALAARGDAEGLAEPVNKLATDENLVVREAAIKALGRLGNASSVAVLAAGFKEGSTAGPQMSQALLELQGGGVVAALIEQAEAGDAAVRQGVLNVLAERRQAEALPVVRKAVTDDEPKIRQAALKALAALGGPEDLPRLTERLLAQKDDSERDPIAQALSTIASRIPDKTTRCEPVLQALSKADAPAKISLLTVLSTLGGDQALQAVRGALTAAGEVRKTAVRVLADWPDTTPMPDLLSVAKDDKDKASQILALRGYIRMLGLAPSRSKLPAYREAMDLATRPEEKRLVLTGLADVAHVDALKMVEPCLEDAALKREAFVAYEKIAESIAGRQPAAAREALTRVMEKATDSGLRNKAQRALEKIK